LFEIDNVLNLSQTVCILKFWYLGGRIIRSTL